MTVVTIDERSLRRELGRLLGSGSEPGVRFLARGEYSVNYLTTDAPEHLVVRCVTGSQIGLSLASQVRYEAHALDLLAPSGRTPRLFAAQPEPLDFELPFLVESYLPGGPLDYALDLTEAARCVADIHQIAAPADHQLQVYAEPGPAIVSESRAWAQDYFDWADGPRGSQAALQRAFGAVAGDLEQSATIFADPDLVIVNYDLNTHNFIVDPGTRRVSLVDWEKARIAPAVQDIAHFVLPTTTLWRTATATHLTPDQTRHFVTTYLACRPQLNPDQFGAQLALMRRLIALRAVSWCAWAVANAATGARAAGNVETLERSRLYLEPEFLDDLFRHSEA